MSIINRLTNVVRSDFTTDDISDDPNYQLAMEELSEELGSYSDTPDASNSVGEKVVNGVKYISGVHAYEERKKCIDNQKRIKAIIDAAEAEAKAKRDNLKTILDKFGRKRLEALKNTVGVFLHFLDRMNIKYAEKEYHFLKTININEEQLSEMKQIDMKASETLKTLAISGGFASVALAGTPTLVTSAVTAVGTASTGTAIGSLSGAAAHNAVLAWLGGGSLASGGGGMAAGATVLTGITVGATAAVGAIAIGSMASAYYSKKHTESEEHLSEVRKWAAELKWACVYMDAIENRVHELESVMKRLYERTVASLKQLEPLVESFDPRDQAQTKIFQQCGFLVKTMGIIAQAPILDNTGDFCNNTIKIMAETEKVLNTEL